ncbi:uncharacterized protein BYT42DRAFT_492044, partial [Radiomyces spectabilis]|uniref:uncharacterized protein n=1 Tax=Radiomyces spectabilis TaxID=64574 RepID=UPI00221EE5FF
SKLEALAGSMVKIAAKDVIATWKIIVAAFAAPMLYAAYTAIYIAYLIKHRPTMSTRSKMIRAAISWIMQPLMHYVLMRLGDSGRDIYKSIKPLFLAIRNPECGKLLQAFRSELSRDITEFVNENASVMLSDVYKESNPESRAQTNIV